MTDYSSSISALEAALGSGELTIRVDGKETTYRSVSEILAALRELRRLQAQTLSVANPVRYGATLATFGDD